MKTGSRISGRSLISTILSQFVNKRQETLHLLPYINSIYKSLSQKNKRKGSMYLFDIQNLGII
jgi:hypothetical protein